jgi:Uncharacterized protein conserved in bacteria
MENNDFSFSPEKLVKLAHMRMPFGKYKDQYLSELPEPYFVWFKQQGFPKNELGRMLEEVLEIKVNGLEYLLRKIRKEYPAI